MPVSKAFGRTSVRFIELTCPGGNGDRWDQHGGLIDGHNKNCKTVDQPIAALIKDLKRTGLLESTLVVGPVNLGERRLHKDPMDGITILLGLPFGWQAAVFKEGLLLVLRMSGGTAR